MYKLKGVSGRQLRPSAHRAERQVYIKMLTVRLVYIKMLTVRLVYIKMLTVEAKRTPSCIKA